MRRRESTLCDASASCPRPWQYKQIPVLIRFTVYLTGAKDSERASKSVIRFSPATALIMTRTSVPMLSHQSPISSEGCEGCAVPFHS